MPVAIQHKAYIFEGEHPELSSSQGSFPYDLDFLVGGARAPAVSFQDSLVETYKLLFHEAFHAFQHDRFSPRSQPESEADEKTLSSRSFNALAEVERTILGDAVASPDVDSVRALLRSYLAVRSHRMDRVDEPVRRLERELEIVEGTAQYIGYAAASVIVGDDSAVSRWVKSDLTQELPLGRFGNPFTGAIGRECTARERGSLFSWTVFGSAGAYKWRRASSSMSYSPMPCRALILPLIWKPYLSGSATMGASSSMTRMPGRSTTSHAA